MYQRIMQGPVEREENKLIPDLNKREIFAIIPIIILIVWIGVHPNTFLKKSEASINKVIEKVETAKKNMLIVN